MRIGQGFDAHALVRGIPLVLGGVPIVHERGLAGDSDGDVLVHAVMDALLGAAHLGDMGTWFRSDDAEVRGARSLLLLKKVWSMMEQKGFQLESLDATIVAERPRLFEFRLDMERNLSEVLKADPQRISVKAKTTDGLGFAGRGEGMAAYANLLLHERPE